MRSNAVTITVDDHGDAPEFPEATEITPALAASRQGVIEHGGDEDYFSFLIPTGQGNRVSIYTTGSLDTVGAMYNVSGDVIRSDDNSGDGDNFKIELETGPHVGNRYYISVGSSGNDFGSYTLHIDRGE